MTELNGTKIDRYTILREVGRGGVATVYKAHDAETDTIVALKVLSPYLVSDSSIRARFQREAEVLETLKHPYILPVLDHGEADGYVYLVLPFMEIGTLSNRLRRGPVKPKEGARIISDIASALTFAHEQGIIHRDIKPSNILITGDGNALLSDFGFIHVDDSQLSLTGSAIIGTPAFMAPEQIRGEEVSERSDQYALGVVLYLMTTGELPYDAETPMGVALKHATDPLPRPRAVNPNLPDAVEAIIVKALAKDPENRFVSVEAFNDAFQDALIASIDPTTGKLRPGAVGEDPSTAVLESVELEDEDRWRGIFARRATIALLLLLLLLACPVGVWAVNEFGGGLGAASEAGEATMVVAMVDSVSTENAEILGTEAVPGELNTAVAATLTSIAPLMEAQQTEGTPLADLLTQTATVSLLEDSNVTPSPSRTEEGSTNTYNDGSGEESSPTSRPPTNTMSPFEPTWTEAPTSTSTSTLPPSRTWTPSPTRTIPPSPTPTASPIPPTATWTEPPPPTNTPDPCDQISYFGFDTHGQELDWSISNGTGGNIKVEVIHLWWPGGNDELKKVELSGSELWQGEDNDPPSHLSSLGGSRQIGSGGSKMMRFYFGDDAGGSGYTLEIEFNNGCSPSTSQ